MIKHIAYGALLTISLAPLYANASLRITEIMYDLSGSDTDREWVEVENFGNAPVDLSTLKLFEANTNHTLKLVQGGSMLPPGSFAVIADVTEKFMIDWPSYSGILFDSSFSLGNTGELLELRDVDLAVLSSVNRFW